MWLLQEQLKSDIQQEELFIYVTTNKYATGNK